MRRFKSFSNKCDILIYKVLCSRIVITFIGDWISRLPIKIQKKKIILGSNTFTLYGYVDPTLRLGQISPRTLRPWISQLWGFHGHFAGSYPKYLIAENMYKCRLIHRSSTYIKDICYDDRTPEHSADINVNASWDECTLAPTTQI